MPQLHFYVPEKTADRIHQEAKAAGLSISQYLAGVIKREFQSDWPEGYFESVVGAWQGEPLKRAEQEDFDLRDPLQFGGG